jgi:hypothetical protein
VLTITVFTIIDNNVMPVTGSMWAMLFSGIWKPGAMWFSMEVHDPGDHVPPADEAGGIVTRSATHMRSPSANTKKTGGGCLISRRDRCCWPSLDALKALIEAVK